VIGVVGPLLLMSGCSKPTGTETRPWQLAWQDEFEGAAGQLPDAAKWGYDIGTGWGNEQLEFDTQRPENVSLDGNGNLAITAREELYSVGGITYDYTSARIVTRDLFEATYGRYEARIKLPVGRGIWPAFWMLGANIETVGWPACGEIDIMEYLGHDPNSIYGTLHGPGYSGAQGIGERFDLTEGRFDTAFHVFSVEWRDDSIKWFVDGVNYHTVKRGDQPGSWVFDKPFYLILNVAVGGRWPGSPDDSTVFPQTMLVDWVRVYR
jgi:beta-glucanase (GH16 family)